MHGNNKKNPNLFHLYRIRDTEEDDIFKYGISQDSVEEDGLSKRVRVQVNLFNRLVGWMRFVGEILIMNIAGRARAEEMEDEHIERYVKDKGRRPRGNPPKRK